MSALAVYRRAFKEVRPFWPHLGVILILGLAATPIALLTPLPLKIIVDGVLGQQPLPAQLARMLPDGLRSGPEAILQAAIGLAVVLVLVTVAHRNAEWLVREWVAERMVKLFRARLFRHALQLATLGQDSRTLQDLAFRIGNDAPALQWTAIYGFIPVIVSLTSLAGTLWVTAGINSTLALLALASAVPAIWLINFNQNRMRGGWHAVKEEESAAQAIVQETLGAVRLVTTFGQEQREYERFVDQARSAVRARLRVLSRQGLLGAALTLSTSLGAIVILYIGVRDVQAKLMTVGDLLLIVAYIAQLYEPLQAIGSHITGQQQAIASAERAFSMLDQKPTVLDTGTRALERAQGGIALEHVSFAYPGGAPLFQDVSLAIPAGTRVGIVGRTGAGKSTVLSLLLRLHDPVSGSIRLDGVDLRDYRLGDLRRQFAVLWQDPVLFSTTIADNIAYARPGASMEDIVAAAKAAQAHDFIVQLPQGYATRVGDRGERLSGGERQRIALARAFLKDAPVLVLDEPTSALDAETEDALVESLERLMQGRTVLMIAHRTGTLRDCDLILRVGSGRIEVEDTPRFDRAA
ncbi:MAG TPA: ABC transporter ATP-binding protein [Xanthobacteraceae bacterium]|nr:ABC transporter ATP-binding protein [Xanthobacteraceae bacterium]